MGLLSVAFVYLKLEVIMKIVEAKIFHGNAAGKSVIISIRK
jgi:hypothetical protein